MDSNKAKVRLEILSLYATHHSNDLVKGIYRKYCEDYIIYLLLLMWKEGKDCLLCFLCNPPEQPGPSFLSPVVLS